MAKKKTTMETNAKRDPTADQANPAELWGDRRLLLGDQYVFLDNPKPVEQCGPACQHRESTIRCPFTGYPCLVGCRLQYSMEGSALSHRDETMFVTSQCGDYLIGEEVVIKMDHPSIKYWRVLNDKRGVPVNPKIEGVSGSLLDMEEGTEIDLTVEEAESATEEYRVKFGSVELSSGIEDGNKEHQPEATQ